MYIYIKIFKKKATLFFTSFLKFIQINKYKNQNGQNENAKAPNTPGSLKRRNKSNVHDHFRTVVDRRYCCEADCSKSYSLKTATTSLMYHLSSAHQITCIDAEDEERIELSALTDKENTPTSSKLNSKL